MSKIDDHVEIANHLASKPPKEKWLDIIGEYDEEGCFLRDFITKCFADFTGLNPINRWRNFVYRLEECDCPPELRLRVVFRLLQLSDRQRQQMLDKLQLQKVTIPGKRKA